MTQDIFISGQPLHLAHRLHQNIAQLLFLERSQEGADQAKKPLFVGPDDQTNWIFTRTDIRQITAWLAKWYAHCFGVVYEALPTKTIAILRLPHTSDALTASLLCASMANGVRVVLPTTIEQFNHLPMKVDAVFADLQAQPDEPTAYTNARTHLQTTLKQSDTPLHCTRTLLTQARDAPPEEYPTIRLLRREQNPQLLTLTTSGTTGSPTWLTYAEQSLMASVMTWQDADLLTEDALGGHSLNLLLSHSMGVRDMLRALWCKKRMLTILPSWVDKRPYQLVRTLCDYPPQLVTCGPALLRIFEQYVAQFPMLQKHLLPQLKCIVSSGTEALGAADFPKHIRQANAFGMSEVMQVTNTLLNNASPHTLGHPLPGVELRLRPSEDVTDAYHLHIRCIYAANDLPMTKDGWFETGDLVYRDEEHLRYAGRQTHDFIQTGMGFKLHRQHVLKHYQPYPRHINDLLIVPHPEHPHPVALAFVGEHDPNDDALRRDLRAWFESRHEHINQRDDLNVAALGAVGIVAGTPPRQALGKLDWRHLRGTHQTLIDALIDPWIAHPHKLDLHDTLDTPSDLQHFGYPYLMRLLEGIQLDWSYTGGEADVLYAQRHGETIEVLDLVGGYGVNLLGHRDTEVLKAAQRALDTQIPINTQTSARTKAGQLSKTLALKLGTHTTRSYITCLANTGAEAVDLALKHALLEHRASSAKQHALYRTTFGHQNAALVRQVIAHNEQVLADTPPVMLALRRGFHGKTLGPLSTLWDDTQRQPFAPLLGLTTAFLPTESGPTSEEALQHTLKQHTLTLHHLIRDKSGQLQIKHVPTLNILGILVEPISGEGGVHVVDPTWLRRLSEVPVPLIVDEIQCGLGRSGEPFAIGDVRPDYLLLGKALGGGVAKISALLIDRSRYQDDFDTYRGSTFAEDDFSSTVALRALERLDELNVTARAQEIGQWLNDALNALAAAYPTVITDVSGKGLMWGITLHHPDDPPSTVTATMARRALGYLSSAYLLNVHHIRVLPTTSAPNTLRIQPSLHFTQAQVQQLTDGLHALCKAWETSNLFELLAHTSRQTDELPQQRVMAQHYSQMPKQLGGFSIERQPPAPGAAKIAFVHNPVHTTKLLLADAPPFALISAEARLELIDTFTQLLEFCPMPSFSRNLFNDKVWMMGITMAVTPAILHLLKRSNQLELIQYQLQQALELAAEHGCTTVVFGAQTSIVSNGATSLIAPEGVQISSGNTFTTAIAMEQMQNLCDQYDIDLLATSTTIGIVGATGSIGKALSTLIIQHDRINARVILIGRQGALKRLNAISRQATKHWPPHAHHIPPKIECADSLDVLERCDIIIAATNTSEPIILPQHIKPDTPVVIADLSEPSAVSPMVSAAHDKARVFQTGFVRLPDDPDFMLSAHSPSGTSFACAAEGILMGLDPDPDLVLSGDVNPHAVLKLQRLGEKWGMVPVPKA